MSDERDRQIIEAWERDDIPTMARLLGEVSIEQAWRPRDEWDEWTHPDSYRGHILAMRDEWEKIPRWLRLLSRIMAWRPWR